MKKIKTNSIKKQRPLFLIRGMKVLILSYGLFVAVFLVLPFVAFAGWKLEVPIPPLSKDADVSLSDYVTTVYNFMAVAVGIIGVLMFLVGGFQYMVSAGNRGMSGEAKKTMINAVVGIILVLAAFIFLRTINQELVQFQGLNFQ